MKRNILLVLHPPYSPDPASSELFVFPKLKSIVKGERLQEVPAILPSATRELKNIPKKEYQKCYKGQDRQIIVYYQETTLKGINFDKGMTFYFDKKNVSSGTL